jgi:hypothetical protein
MGQNGWRCGRSGTEVWKTIYTEINLGVNREDKIKNRSEKEDVWLTSM